ncbi:MAG: thioredoxin [Dictyoglomus sp.]|nr:thioredoxin [Dictyoglomus sp.]MCX7942469.1 thioredoxin [Dictyoglomaceae bacterium]MDW8189167.1 thioredoxin domain-containing protein [Dictyoglomus sp.]
MNINSKFLLKIFIIFLLFLTSTYSSPQENVSRKLVLELFTATWCGPCARYGPLVDKIYDQFSNQIILLRNQVWHDGLDTKETNNRANYYRIEGVPTLIINGKYAIHPAYYDEIIEIINDILKEKPIYSLEIYDLKRSGNKISFKIGIESLSNTTKNLKLFVIFYEKLVHYEGRNGEKKHRFVIRDYIPDERGKSIKINPKENLELKIEYDLHKNFSPNKFSIAVFLQDVNTKEIYNGEKIEL